MKDLTKIKEKTKIKLANQLATAINSEAMAIQKECDLTPDCAHQSACNIAICADPWLDAIAMTCPGARVTITFVSNDEGQMPLPPNVDICY